jgi:hypothetical protein
MAVAGHQADPAADHVAWPSRSQLGTLDLDPAGRDTARPGKSLENLFLTLTLETRKPNYFAAP